MKNLSPSQLTLLLPLLIVGCGGGSSSDSSTESADTINIDSTDTEGFLSEPKFTLSAQACASSTSDQALAIDDGFDVSTLTSSDLVCTQTNNGDNIVYNISWSGNDFNNDGENDTLTFDVKVAAFADSTFSYSETAGESSMTALGSASTISYWVDEDESEDGQDTSVWDIDSNTALGETNEAGMGEGQSLRFNVENIAVSLDNYQVEFNGFNSINVIETKGGREHTHIRGQGTGLDSGTTNSSATFDFDPTETFVITGSGDYYDNNIWGVSDIEFSFSIDNPDLVSANSAEWLAGSWGVTFPVFGGERLDTEVNNNYDLRAGAQELVDELPAAGHVFTNLSYFAHSHYFTLRENPNVDIANEIDPSLVPTLENEQIILDVLQTFKDADKKIILYISTNYMDRASDEAQAAWQVYYTNEFAGDEYLAYENLIQGFVERFKDYADGYWLDTTSNLIDDGKLEDFISMIKKTDPTSIVSANANKNYFSENGSFIYVDSDGVDDTDETDYKIVLHEPLNSYQDFTNGHVTPLTQGAPPNSFGYEEYTLPNMVEEPWVTYDGKSVLKHAWFPVRQQWHSPRADLVFGVEQAYRFVKTAIDGNTAITLANTIDYGIDNPGYMMRDEMEIMKEINARLMMETPPTPEVYVRPEGASLLGE